MRDPSVTFQASTAGPMAMLNPPSVRPAISIDRRRIASVSGLTFTAPRPAAAFTRDSSLLGIQVLRSPSRRWISRNPAVHAAWATSPDCATAVIVTRVPMCVWARLMTTGAELAGACQQPAWEAIVSRTTTAQLRGRITCLGRGLRGMLLVPTSNAGGRCEDSGDKASLHRDGTRQKQESAAPWRLGAHPD